jgi:hypothetical protein
MRAVRLRPATREERQLALLWSAAAVSAVVLRPVWMAVAPHLRSCTFRSLTGVPCPTCGTTRTALALLDLDFLAALAVNPLATVAGAVFVVGGVLAFPWAVLRGPAPATTLRWNRRWTIALVGLILINWTYLILTK